MYPLRYKPVFTFRCPRAMRALSVIRVRLSFAPLTLLLEISH